MSTVHPSNELQPFTTPPWAHEVPKTPYVDTDLGEKKWEELKHTLAPTINKVEDTIEEVADVTKDTWSEWMESGEEKLDNIKGKSLEEWEKIKTTARDTIIDGKEVVQEKFEGLKQMAPELKAQGKDILEQVKEAAEIGKEKIMKGKAILEEKLSEASEVGKEKLAEASEIGKEKLAEATVLGKEMLNQGREKLAEMSEIGKEKLAEATEIGKEKLAEVREFGKEKLAEATVIGKEKVVEASETGKGKLADITQKAAELGLGVMEPTKEWISKKVSEIPTVEETAHIAKEKLDQAGASLSEKVETVIESVKETLPPTTVPRDTNDKSNIWRNDAKMTHSHKTDSNPSPMFKTLSQKIEKFMESGAVYKSPAPYTAQCPVIRSDMCPTANYSFTPMPW